MGHNEDLYDVIIAGAGPAGLSAAVYMARARYRVLVMEKEKIGGQITITSEIVNYPGVERTSGRELTRSMKEQSCRDFIKAMESLGHSAEGMSGTLIHILCRSFFQQLHEFVSHGLPREQAVTCAVTLSRFQHAGWVRIMELDE